MKIFTAVVATITDYRKNQSLKISCVSSHPTEREAKKAALLEICKALQENGELLALNSFDKFFDISTMVGEPVTEFRFQRMLHWMQHDGEMCGEEEDVPKDDDKLDAFFKIEEPIVKKLVEVCRDGFGDKELSFSQEFENSTEDFDMPDLPNGEYVWDPIVYTIEEQEFDEIDSGDRKRKSKE
jgi:hypothetical protein